MPAVDSVDAFKAKADELLAGARQHDVRLVVKIRPCGGKAQGTVSDNEKARARGVSPSAAPCSSPSPCAAQTYTVQTDTSAAFAALLGVQAQVSSTLAQNAEAGEARRRCACAAGAPCCTARLLAFPAAPALRADTASKAATKQNKSGAQRRKERAAAGKLKDAASVRRGLKRAYKAEAAAAAAGGQAGQARAEGGRRRAAAE